MAKRSAFITPETVRLDLDGYANGDLDDEWVEIKGRLTFKEREVMNAAVLTSMPMGGAAAGNGQYGVDIARYNLIRLQTYLVEWSLKDGKGKQLDCRPRNIENLDPEYADAILNRIERYEEEQKAAGKANGSASGSALSLVSSSPPAGAGGS